MRTDKVKVLLWGFGAMGQGIARLLLEKEGFQIIGVCDHHHDLVGQDIFQVLTMDQEDHPRIIISEKLEDHIFNDGCDVAILAMENDVHAFSEKIKWLITKHVNVITTAEEFVYLKARYKDLADEIDDLAKKYSVTVLGTGVNPGMMMDLIVLFLTGMMQDIDKMTVKRVSSLSPFGKDYLDKRGIGLTEDEFKEQIQSNESAYPIGLKESTEMIADGLGISVDQYAYELRPIVSDVDRQSKFIEISEGLVAGIHQSSTAICDDGHLTIQLYLNQQLEPEEIGVLTGDYVYIEGRPGINLAIRPEVDGGIATIAISVNMIPHVINAKPGLKTMLDLPVPRAIIGDVRSFIEP